MLTLRGIAKSTIGRKAWTWYFYDVPQEVVGSYPAKTYMSIIEQDHFDCQERSVLVAQEFVYSGQLRSSTVISSLTFPVERAKLIDVA